LLVAGWIVLTALLVAAGVAVTHSASVGAFDRHVTAVVVAHRTDSLTSAMKVITWLGTWVALVVTLGLFAVLCLRRRLPMLVVGIALVAWAGEASGVAIGKALVGRPRPPERIWLTLAHGSSWPSGHAAVAVLVFGTLALATSQIVGRRSVRVLAWALAALVSVAVAYSRVELGVHWCTDTIASFLFVTGWLAMVVVVLRRAVGPATLPRPDPITPEAGPVTT
jgi:undecaprenyl-diphosphatase